MFAEKGEAHPTPLLSRLRLKMNPYTSGVMIKITLTSIKG